MIALSDDANVRRFSVSLPPTLVDEFDETWKAMRYESRSKAVHDSFRSFISETHWMRNDEGNATGVIVILHYVERPELTGEINQIQRRYRSLIRSMNQFFVEENKMLEVVAVDGEIKKIKDLVQELMAVKGVKQVKSAFITP